MNTKAKENRHLREIKKILNDLDYDVTLSKASLGVFDGVAVLKRMSHSFAAYRVKPAVIMFQSKSNRINRGEKLRIQNFQTIASKEIWIHYDYKGYLRSRWSELEKRWEEIERGDEVEGCPELELPRVT